MTSLKTYLKTTLTPEVPERSNSQLANFKKLVNFKHQYFKNLPSDSKSVQVLNIQFLTMKISVQQNALLLYTYNLV